VRDGVGEKGRKVRIRAVRLSVGRVVLQDAVVACLTATHHCCFCECIEIEVYKEG
jgi:hypothetical protein